MIRGDKPCLCPCVRLGGFRLRGGKRSLRLVPRSLGSLHAPRGVCPHSLQLGDCSLCLVLREAGPQRDTQETEKLARAGAESLCVCRKTPSEMSRARRALPRAGRANERSASNRRKREARLVFSFRNGRAGRPRLGSVGPSDSRRERRRRIRSALHRRLPTCACHQPLSAAHSLRLCQCLLQARCLRADRRELRPHFSELMFVSLPLGTEHLRHLGCQMDTHAQADLRRQIRNVKSEEERGMNEAALESSVNEHDR